MRQTKTGRNAGYFLPPPPHAASFAPPSFPSSFQPFLRHSLPLYLFLTPFAAIFVVQTGYLHTVSTVVARSCTGACCRNATGCCDSPHVPLIKPGNGTPVWCSSIERTAGPICTASIYIPRFTELEGRAILSIEVEQIDFDARSEFISSIIVAGKKIGDVFHPKQENSCGHLSRILDYEVPLHVYGNQFVSISTSEDVNDRFLSQNCNGKSLNARITLSIHLRRLFFPLR